MTKMSIDREIFFNGIYSDPFGGSLSQPTVDGIEVILDVWDDSPDLSDLRWLAYMLATVLGEVGRGMQPVREGFKATDAAARAYVKSKGYGYAKEVNGQVYYGRGVVQITWESNYHKMGDILGINLLKDPDLALQPDIATRIMFEGMIRGTFTGKKLYDYFYGGTSDWKNARRIVNALDRADEIAAYGRAFHVALQAAAHLVVQPPPVPDPPPAPSLEERVAALEARLDRLESNNG